MTKQFAISIGIFAILAVSLAVVQPRTLQSEAAAAQQGTQTVARNSARPIEYGRLIFEDDNYNFIAGDGPVLRATSIKNLITRLGGRAARSNFATLLDTLGANGWELIIETEDPEGYGQVLIFKR